MVLNPESTLTDMMPSAMAFFESILILAPAKSAYCCGLKVLSIPIFSTMSVLKILRLMFFRAGLSEGRGRPFNVVTLYRSPSPRTKTLPEPSCFEIPVTLDTAVAASPTPFRESSCAPMAVFWVTAFFCSNKRATSLSLRTVVVITTSSKVAALAPMGTFTVVTLSSSTTISVISTVS